MNSFQMYVFKGKLFSSSEGGLNEQSFKRVAFEKIFVHIYTYIQGVSKGSLQNLRGDSAHHKDTELHRNPCPQTLS